MLSIFCTEASRFENAILNKQFTLPINKRKYFIGRGEELEEKLSQNNGIIDLTNFDNTLSRVHACLFFSPAWLDNTYDSVPPFMHSIAIQQQKLPPDVVYKIWEFIKPQKQCLLKDLKSKVGIFSKVDSLEIQSETIIEFVHQSFIEFEHFEQYQTLKEVEEKVNLFQECQPKPIIFGNLARIRLHYDTLHSAKDRKQLLKIWHLSIRQIKYVMLMEEGMILRIGRSSHCQIQIKDTAISRYQAYLKCEDRKWKIYDGNLIEKSKNGTWKRQKAISIPVSKTQTNPTKSYLKIGTIKCQIQLIEQFQWLNVQKIASGDISKSFIQIGMAAESAQQNQETNTDLDLSMI